MNIRKPTRQRELPRRPAGTLPPQRPSVNTVEHQQQLARRLTDRDRWITRMVHEHRVLTSDQIITMAFTSSAVGLRRLRELSQWEVLDRFQPHSVVGNLALHFVLGPAGASVMAGELDLDPKAFGYRRERVNSITSSPRLAHLVGVNDWFASLVAHARARPDTRVEAWWSEARCARHFGDLVRPDGYGRVAEAGRRAEFFLEYDTGTESLPRVAAKLPGYAALAAVTAITTPLVLWLPSLRREAAARWRLHTALSALDNPYAVPLATAGPDLLDPDNPAACPADPVWLPLHPDRPATERIALADLGRAWPHLPPLTEARTAAPGDPAEDATGIRAARQARTVPAPAPMPPPVWRPPPR